MKNPPVLKFFIFVAIAFILGIASPNASYANNTKTIAILPFETIATEDISYIQSGILRMLHSRLTWKDQVHVIPQKNISQHLISIKDIPQNQRIKKIFELTDADYVLAGSITQFSDAFSIDIQFYDIKNNRYMTFFEQSKLISDLVVKVNFICAKINKKAFERKTITYDQMVNKEKAKYDQLERQNPERLMPAGPQEEPWERTSPWKFWEYL